MNNALVIFTNIYIINLCYTNILHPKNSNNTHIDGNNGKNINYNECLKEMISRSFKYANLKIQLFPTNVLLMAVDFSPY